MRLVKKRLRLLSALLVCWSFYPPVASRLTILETYPGSAGVRRRRTRVLVLGGDCTVELGTVAGALRGTQSVGVVYIDLDTDLNTPESTSDGALDWMGVAHLLGIRGSLPELVQLGPRTPMLQPDQLLFFANRSEEHTSELQS